MKKNGCTHTPKTLLNRHSNNMSGWKHTSKHEELIKKIRHFQFMVRFYKRCEQITLPFRAQTSTETFHTLHKVVWQRRVSLLFPLISEAAPLSLLDFSYVRISEAAHFLLKHFLVFILSSVLKHFKPFKDHNLYST